MDRDFMYVESNRSTLLLPTREKLAPLVLVDLRVHRDPAESLVPLDLLDPLAHL